MAYFKDKVEEIMFMFEDTARGYYKDNVRHEIGGLIEKYALNELYLVRERCETSSNRAWFKLLEDRIKELEAEEENRRASALSGKKMDRKAVLSLKKQNDILYKITFDLMRGEILLNDKMRLGRPHLNSENEAVMEYLIAHPNKKVTKKDIEEKTGIEIGKDFHKIIENLGFTGPYRKTFFRTTASSIVFRNPITKDNFKKLGIPLLKINK